MSRARMQVRFDSLRVGECFVLPKEKRSSRRQSFWDVPQGTYEKTTPPADDITNIRMLTPNGPSLGGYLAPETLVIRAPRPHYARRL